MVKKVYILPQTTIDKQFVMTQCLCVSKDERESIANDINELLSYLAPEPKEFKQLNIKP